MTINPIWALTMGMMLLVVMQVSHMIMSKNNTKKNTKTPFECGFSTKKTPEIPFSIQFFMVSVLFIIFDIEISMILSMMTSSMTMPLKKWAISSMMFMMIMQGTLLYEMTKSSMKWMK